MSTTNSQGLVSTGTSIKTLLQIATPSTRQIQILEWGFSLSANPTGTVELLQTDVAATVTAHVASGVQPLDPNAPASLMTLGVNATGYNASVEGSITTTRMFDAEVIAQSSPLTYAYQFMPDARPIVAVSKFLRVRATMTSSVNCSAWIVWDE